MVSHSLQNNFPAGSRRHHPYQPPPQQQQQQQHHGHHTHAPANKPSPSLLHPQQQHPAHPQHPGHSQHSQHSQHPQHSQHASPYQPQPYAPQPSTQNSYAHHLFSGSAPSQVPTANTVPNVQNAVRPPPTQQQQQPPSLPGPRGQQQRVPPSRMQQSSYLHQSLNHQQPLHTALSHQQPMSQSMSQPMSQSMSQPMSQSMSQSIAQPMPQQQPMNPQQLSQQSLGPHALGHQTLSQQSHNQQPINQPSMNQQPMTQQPMPQQPMNQQPMNQQPMNQPMSHALQLQPMTQPPMPQQPGSQQPPMSQLQLQPVTQPPMSHSPAQQQSLRTPDQRESSVLSQQSAHQHLQTRSLPQPNPPSALPTPPQPHQVQKAHLIQQVNPPPTPPRPEPPAPARDEHPDEDGDVEEISGVGERDSSQEPKARRGSAPREPQGPLMSAPPEGGSFSTMEELQKYALSYCISVGYAVVIGRSKKTVPGLKKVLFVCDRAGKPPRRVPDAVRKRKTTSRKCDCPFGFFAIEQRDKWIIRYRPDATHMRHNHTPSESPMLHPSARKLDNKMVAVVKELKDTGQSVNHTLNALQEVAPGVPLLPRDIYNARAAIQRNQQKAETTAVTAEPATAEAAAAEAERPAPATTIYSKPHPSAEERIRADLRKELAKAREETERVRADMQKRINMLEDKLKDKDTIIGRFEQFIDICNQRVIIKLHTSDSAVETTGS